MTHTVDDLMALAEEYADAECRDYLTGEASSLWYRDNLRTALTEALKNQQNSDTSQENVEKSVEIKQIGCVQHDCNECKSRAAQPARESANFHILSITAAYEQGVGKGHQAFKRGNDIENPYTVPSDCAKAWDYGYEEGKIQASRLGDKT